MDNDSAKEQQRLWRQLQEMRTEGKDIYQKLEPTATMLYINSPSTTSPTARPPVPSAFPSIAPISGGSYMDTDRDVRWQHVLNSLTELDAKGSFASVRAWAVAKSFVQPRKLGDPVDLDESQPHQSKSPGPLSAPGDPEAVEAALLYLKERGMLPSLYGYWTAALSRCFWWIENEVRLFMNQWETKETVETIERLIFRVYHWYQAWSGPLEAFSLDPPFEKHARGHFILLFRNRFLRVLPPTFVDGLRCYLRSLFHNLQAHAEVFRMMVAVGISEHFDKTFLDVLYQEIENKIQEICPGQWRESKLESLKRSAKAMEEKWLGAVYGHIFGGSETNDLFKSAMMMVSGKLDYFISRALIEVRTSEIFDIIVEYPETAPAINDLRICLYRSFFRKEFVQGLRNVISRRILQPAADTDDIVTFYVSLIRCLRIVDPQGVVLHKVASPIRKYLRDRPDTVRCIVKRMTDENQSLLDHGEQVVPIQQVHEAYDDYSDPHWQPEPTDAGAEFRTSRPMDIVSTLVSIYDTQDLFIKELQHLLASRLLGVRNSPLDEEIKNVEMLKLRFGEAPLQVCAVMLKDMMDSRRTNQHLHGEGPHPLYTTVISRLFWPPVPNVPLHMPGQFRVMQEAFEVGFHKFKPDKKLRWAPQLGAVHLELQMADRKVETEATPIQAAVIELFSEKDTWTVTQLMSQLGDLERVLVESSLEFWAVQGLLKASGETYKLLEVAEANQGSSQARRVLTTEEQPVDEREQQQASQMKMYWQYIQGMLTNLNSLPIDKIQAMLKFAPGYDRSVQELAVFLESARKEGLVLFSNGSWKLLNK